MLSPAVNMGATAERCIRSHSLIDRRNPKLVQGGGFNRTVFIVTSDRRDTDILLQIDRVFVLKMLIYISTEDIGLILMTINDDRAKQNVKF
jgi:hypothetical protein